MANPPSKYLFVDGNYLLCRASQVAQIIGFSGKPHELLHFPSIASGNERSFFIDSFPQPGVKNYEQKRQEKEDLFRSVNLTKDFRVSHGLSRYSGETRQLRQKGVDVLLAITAYQHAIRGNMDIAVIIAGDLDFLPLFEALSETRVRTHLMFYHEKAPHDLVQCADQITMVTPYSFQGWMSPSVKNKYANVHGAQYNETSGLPKIINAEKARIGTKTIIVGLSENEDEYIAYIEGTKSCMFARNKEIAASCYLEYPFTQLKFEPV